VDSGKWAVSSGRWRENCGRCTVDREQWTGDRGIGQLIVDSGEREKTVDGAQWIENRRQWEVGS